MHAFKKILIVCNVGDYTLIIQRANKVSIRLFEFPPVALYNFHPEVFGDNMAEGEGVA